MLGAVAVQWVGMSTAALHRRGGSWGHGGGAAARSPLCSAAGRTSKLLAVAALEAVLRWARAVPEVRRELAGGHLPAAVRELKAAAEGRDSALSASALLLLAALAGWFPGPVRTTWGPLRRVAVVALDAPHAASREAAALLLGSLPRCAGAKERSAAWDDACAAAVGSVHRAATAAIAATAAEPDAEPDATAALPTLEKQAGLDTAATAATDPALLLQRLEVSACACAHTAVDSDGPHRPASRL